MPAFRQASRFPRHRIGCHSTIRGVLTGAIPGKCNEWLLIRPFLASVYPLKPRHSLTAQRLQYL